MERWENMAEDDPWLALARSSLSHEGSYQLLRSELEAQQAAPLSNVPGFTPQCGRELCALACVSMSGTKDRAGRPATALLCRGYQPARSLR